MLRRKRGLAMTGRSPLKDGIRKMFRYATSVYGGSDLLIGANWDLLKWFVAAGFAFIVAHAAFKAVASRAQTQRAD